MSLSRKIKRNNARKKIKNILKESDMKDQLRALMLASDGAKSELDAGVVEAAKQIKSGEYVGALEKFFNGLGFVDPCDLVRKDPNEIKSQADKIEYALGELKRAEAENINDRLGSFANVVGAAGAGSLAYFAFNNLGNLPRAGAGQIWDLVRNTENDKVNKEIMQAAGSAEAGTTAEIQAIKTIDDALAADYEPAPALSNADQVKQVRNAGASPEVSQTAMNIADRWSSSGFDKSDSFPDGKDYRAFQTFQQDDPWFAKNKWHWDDRNVDSGLKKRLRKKSNHTRDVTYEEEGSMFRHADTNKHPDYIEFKKIVSDPAGKAALLAAFQAKSTEFAELGYKDPRAYWDSVNNNMKQVSAISQNAERNPFRGIWDEFKGNPPTQWQKYYNPKGSATQRLGTDVATLNMVPDNRVPTNAMTCDDPSEVPTITKDGKRVCAPAINWNKKGWATAGKYLVIGSAVLHTYRLLLSLAPEGACSIKNFISKVVSGLSSFVSSTVGKIVDGIKYVIDGIVNGIKSLFESRNNLDTTYYSVKEWKKLNETMAKFTTVVPKKIIITKSQIKSIVRSTVLKEESMKDNQTIDSKKILNRINKKIAENRKKSNIKNILKIRESKLNYIKKHSNSTPSLASVLLSENTFQLAPPQAIQAAQAQVSSASSEDALDIFGAMQGAGTDEKMVQKVIKKRINDLDKLFLEFEGLLRLAREHQKTALDRNLAGSKKAAAVVGAGVGLWAITPDKYKKKVVDSISSGVSDVATRMQGALGYGNKPASPEEVKAQLAAVGINSAEDAKAAIASFPLVRDFAQSSNSDVLRQIDTIETGSSMAAPEIVDYGFPKGTTYKLSGDAQMPWVDLALIHEKDRGKIPDMFKAGAVFKGPDGKQLSQEQVLSIIGPGPNDPKPDYPEDFMGPKMEQKKIIASVILSEVGVGMVAQALGAQNAGKAVAQAAVAGFLTQQILARTKTFFDGIGLSDNLIDWLEDDGMSEEAEMVQSAVDAAGIDLSKGY
jgi:hypothetical protein